MEIAFEKLGDYLEIAKSAAMEAGKYLISKRFSDLQIFSEEGRDIKLEVDRQTENIIRQRLTVTGISILGEEFGDNNVSSTLKWIIDPLDGTSNYFRGLDQCCISIALMDNEVSLLGVIYNFNSNELFLACKNKGAFLNGRSIKVSRIEKKEQATLTTGFPASETLESSISYLKDLSAWKKVRMFGSAALSCAYVASGRCDVYQEKGVYLWDFAAGICLVEEAGGKAIYQKIDDSRYTLNFTNGTL
jgi:myo-inositol-1(or 4)-monophosphatase